MKNKDLRFTVQLNNGDVINNSDIPPCTSKRPWRFKNYLAIIKGLDSDCEEIREYLNDYQGTTFHTTSVKVGDVVKASCWDKTKKEQEVCYYNVLDINNDSITLDYGCNTYKEALEKSSTQLSKLQEVDEICEKHQKFIETVRQAFCNV